MNDPEKQAPPPEPTMPDARQIAYIACVLHRDSQSRLLSTVDEWTHSNIPRMGWTARAHHMTVIPPGKIKQADLPRMPWGQEVELTVTDWAWDRDAGYVVVVEPNLRLPFAEGQVPHITVAHSMLVNPSYSNSILADHNNWDQPRSPLVLRSYFVGVMSNNPSAVWPSMGSLLLAAPSLSLGNG